MVAEATAPRRENVPMAHSFLWNRRNLVDAYFSGQNLLIILVILLKEFRRVQLVGTFLHTLSAVETVFDFFHIRLPGFIEPGGGRRPAHHQGHAGAVVDEDAEAEEPVEE